MSSRLTPAFASPACEVSQFPSVIYGHAPSPLTPENRTAAHIRCFTVRAGLALFDGLAALIGVSRLIRVRLSLRLAPSPSEASRAGSLRRHARSATWLTDHSTVNSFQF